MKFLKTIGIISDQGIGMGFSGPIATAFDSQNTAFVLNRGHEDQGSGNLFRVTVQTFEEDFLTEFATWYGNKLGDKKLNTPSDLEFDSNDRLYITDEVNNEVLIYDNESNYIGKWGKAGNKEGELSGPSGITIDSKNNIYISEQYNNRIQKFSKDGEFISSWGKFGTKYGEFNLPWGISVDKKDNIYVADWRNNRIQKFSKDGEFITLFENNKEKLLRPSDVAVDSNGYIYISDWGNERVVVLDENGKHISNERGKSTLSTAWTDEFFESNIDERDSRAKANLIPDLPEHLQTPYHISSQSEPLFWGITDLSIDNLGRLYVTEFRRHRCQIFNLRSA
ncbi:MAG: 6-bladed beta-propeller [SAR202 cluster bacterium]|nr:6-bladed beta-propeller [SAR202 cluster bacterium]|tara:strand:+ start:25240 stop:26250 length:1011 start_codon:yes stop_codon:yes gene_type:complete